MRPGECCWDARKTLMLLSFLGLMIFSAMEVCLAIAIVAIVKRNVTTDITEDEAKNVCPAPENAPEDSVVESEYEWSDQIQAIILGAFFLGTMVTNFPGGRAAEYVGPRLMFGLGIFISSILTLLSPLCVYVSPFLLIAVRVLEGMAQGVCLPSLHFLMSAWIPPKGKAKFWSILITGFQIGNILAMSVGGWLCSTTFLGGWPSVFYVFGSLGVIWAIPWFLLIHDFPEHHPRISDAELQFILEHRHYVKMDKVVVIPWHEIATSRPFWAIMASTFCSSYSFFTLLTELPTYFNKILHFDMSKNGFSSAMPHVMMIITSISWSIIVDKLQKRNVLSVNTVRKLSTSLGLYLPAACLIGMMWVNCDSTMAMVVMCLAVGFMGLNSSGYQLSEQDIAPNLAGTLKGLTNTLGSTTAFVAIAITGAITNGNQTVPAWNTVFVISAIFNLIFGTIYVAFGTDKVQLWNDSKPKKVSVSIIPRLSVSRHKQEIDGSPQNVNE